MANLTITQLPNAQPLAGTESVPVVQNGQTVQTTTGAIARSYQAQLAPVDFTADATLTATQMRGGLITVTSSNPVTLTLPLGITANAELSNMTVNRSFYWNVINLGTQNVVIANNTDHDFVGNNTIPANSSAGFMTVKTATDTFVTYKIS